MHIVQLWYVWLLGLLLSAALSFILLFWGFKSESGYGSPHAGKMIVAGIFLSLVAAIFGTLLGLAVIGDVLTYIFHVAH